MADDRTDKRRTQLESFRAVVAERIVQMNVTWIQLEQGVGDRSIGDALLRELHTLKGEASLLGFRQIAELTHALEDIVGIIAVSGQPPSEDTGDSVLRAFDLISALSEREPGQETPEAAHFLATLKKFESGPHPAPDPEAIARADAMARVHAEVETEVETVTAGSDADDDGGGDDSSAESIEVATARFPAHSLAPHGNGDSADRTGSPDGVMGLRPPAAYAVRVNPTQLDRIRDIIGDLLLTRSRLAAIASALHRERRITVQHEGDPSSDASGKDVHADTDHREVLRSIESQLRDDMLRMSTLVMALDDVTRDLRMVSISVLTDRYPMAVRSIGRALGRQVQLVCRGEWVQADREVLEALEEPLLHLVRNAVDHGIEPPEERKRAGKPVMGTIVLDASVVGDSLRLDVSDDGAGIDVERVRTLAIERGAVDAHAARNMSARDVLQYLFVPGMSTRTSITSISGRGIGLDVVHKTAQNLGGSVAIETKPGLGTTFRIHVPIRASITSVLLFRVGLGWYALPTSTLIAIEELDAFPIAASIDGPALHYKDSLVPLVALEPALGEPQFDTQQGRRRTRVVLVKHGSLVIGLTGSYNHLQREAVLKSVAPLFRDDQLITAGLALEDGSVALVINPGEFFRASRGLRRRDLGVARAAAEVKPEPATSIVLVAEDSPIVRDLIVDSLRVHGLEVVEAADGQEALEKLAENPNIDLLVTDVEMPRLDGLALIKKMRMLGGRRIPAIVVSTRGSDADKLAAVKVGADAYLVKSDFSREGLWALVSRFLG